MVKWWKHSRLRFYWKNAIWNYQFWLHAKPIYKDHHYKVEDGLDMEKALTQEVVQVKTKMKNKTQKRFAGFMYRGMLYQDNPGIQGIDKDTWDAWIQKGLVQL